MNTPDKMYMPNELLSEEWQRHIEGQDTEYIRKDALLEWAKEKYVQADMNANATDDRIHYGELLAFKELIDKLNTL